MHPQTVDAILLTAACRVSADTSSLILLNRCRMLPQLCRTTSVIITPGVLTELQDRKGSTKEDNSVYYQLIEQKLVEVAGATRATVDDSVVWLQHSGRADAVLSDDGRICARCRQRRIPYMNALIAIYRVWVRGDIADATYCRARTRLLQLGRYSARVAAVALGLGPANV